MTTLCHCEPRRGEAIPKYVVMKNHVLRHKAKILVVLLSVLLFTLLSSYSFAATWQEMGGDHFIVYYSDDEDFAKDVLDKAEEHYKRIATELGYPRYSEFWTWDNRVKIYLYRTKADYLKAVDMPEWSDGMADYVNKRIVSFRSSEDFTESFLPHEMAHLIFRDFVGFTGEIPLWLDEGIAQWSEQANRREMQALAKEYYMNDKMLLMEDVMNLNMKALKKIDRVYIRANKMRSGENGVLFLSTDQLVNTFYLQSVSVIGFLLERYGSLKFADFCRRLRDGNTVEQALKLVYPNSIQNLEALEDNWRGYLEKQ